MGFRKKKTLLDQASDYIDQVRPQVESAVASAFDAAEEFYEKTALPALADAREKAAPALADARERASAAIADARESAGPALADVRTKAAPVVAAGAAKATQVAAQAKEAADAKVAQLRGEEPPKKKGGKLKKLAFLAAIAGAVGFVAKKLQGGQNDNWQSSYVPTPAPAAPAASATATSASSASPAATADDAGAAGPDEALSDLTDEPKAATTPDAPAEVVDLDTPVADTDKS